MMHEKDKLRIIATMHTLKKHKTARQEEWAHRTNTTQDEANTQQNRNINTNSNGRMQQYRTPPPRSRVPLPTREELDGRARIAHEHVIRNVLWRCRCIQRRRTSAGHTENLSTSVHHCPHTALVRHQRWRFSNDYSRCWDSIHIAFECCVRIILITYTSPSIHTCVCDASVHIFPFSVSR